MKLAAAVAFSASLMSGCGDSERPAQLSDAENDQSGRTPLIASASGSGSGSSAVTASDCASQSWLGDFVAHSQSDLKKLSGYTSVVGDMWVEPATSNGMTDVSSLGDLRCLETVFGSITIQGNPSLYNLTGFEKLTQADSLNISGNSSLETLSGPSKLSLSSTLRVTSNDALTSLSSGIVAAGSLVIEDNPQLSQCIATSLAKTLQASCTCDGNLDSVTCN